MNNTQELTSQMVLDSLNEGVYVTDLDRTIRYWGKAAERITGWPAREVVGRRCRDGILCHVDKDGHPLCGEEYCPLHRSIVTGQRSVVPIMVLAQTCDGGHVPLQVAVSPLRNSAGEVIGGVETFRDISHEVADINRARKIQMLSLQQELPADPRIRFTTRYVPHDIIGGDFCSVARLNPDQYGFLLADVMGHGVPAALYTMFLSSLWASHQPLLVQPTEFARVVGDRLEQLIEEDEPFAAALCGVFDLARGELRFAAAGNPPPLITRADGTWEEPQAGGPPLGLLRGAEYEQTVVPLHAGDSVLFFTDGATEIGTASGSAEMLGSEGLRRILEEVGYPAADPPFDEIEGRLLAASDRIRFDDDLTFLNVRIKATTH